MKTPLLLIFLSLFTVASSSSFAQSGTGSPIGEFEVKFTNQLTFDDLVKIRQDIRLKGVEISYNKLAFDSNHKLKAIDLTASAGEKNVAKVSEDNLTEKIVISLYNNKKGFGTSTLPAEKK